MGTPGGNSVMNAGQIAVVGSKYQKLGKIEDSTDLMMNDMCKAGIDLNHLNLLTKMITESNSLLKWLEQDLNIKFRERVTQLGGHSVPRTVSTLNACGNDIINPMLEKIDAMPNVELMTNTAFQDFVVSHDDDDESDEKDGSEQVSVDGIHVVSKKDDDEHTEQLLCKKGFRIENILKGYVFANRFDISFSADVRVRKVLC